MGEGEGSSGRVQKPGAVRLQEVEEEGEEEGKILR